MTISPLPTGLPALDSAIGIGGFPRGRITLIYGDKSSGKTALAMTTMAKTQADGGKCFYIDAECAFNYQYAEKLGVDTKKVSFVQTEFGYGEDYLAEVEKIIALGKADLIVLVADASNLKRNLLFCSQIIILGCLSKYYYWMIVQFVKQYFSSASVAGRVR